MNPPKNELETPPKNTIAVVVDVLNFQGAIYIENADDKQQVDKVGPMPGQGNMVMVPWQSHWCYRPIGSPRVAYIMRKA